MNVDLLMAADGQAALLFDQGFRRRVTGIGLHPDTLTVFVLFERGEQAEMNIPLELPDAQRLGHATIMHLALVADNRIAHIKQVPFVGARTGRPGKAVPQSVLKFGRFLSQPLDSRPVHRESVGNESTARSLARQLPLEKLPLAPDLERQRNQELATPAPRYRMRGPRPK